MSAPARLIASRCSSATAVPSSQPSCAAAFTIAYSPLTWYAATGTSNGAADIARSRRDTASAGFTITMSAPSSTSSATSASASRPLAASIW